MKLYMLTGAAFAASMVWSVPATACHDERGGDAGVICLSPAPRGPVYGGVQSFVTREEMRLVGWISGSLDTVTWATAARVANKICVSRGFRAGLFDGYERGGLPSIHCMAVGVSLLRVTIETVYASGLIVGDLSNIGWPQAARAAGGLCEQRGFTGGFFDGSHIANRLGLVCTGPEMGLGEQPEYGAPRGLGAPPPQPGYGAPPIGEDLGAPPPQPGYGAPPIGKGHGAPPIGNGHGAPPPQPGYGAPPIGKGHGAPPIGNGYGAPPPQPGYGAPPIGNGYGAPPAQPGYGVGQGAAPSPGTGLDLGEAPSPGTGLDLGEAPSPGTGLDLGEAPSPGTGLDLGDQAGAGTGQFDVGLGDIRRGGFDVGDVTRVTWSYAARIAYSLCVERGYDSGFFDGTRSTGGFGLTCVD